MAHSVRARPAVARGIARDERAPLVALGVLTALAFALRVVGIDQTLYGDEYFTHAIVTENGLRGVWSAVYHTSITPPLHYGLAWLAVQFGGDSTVLVRLPSLILGTAIVPLVFVLAGRIGNARAGLLAAALMALSPFAIWYSDEARAYATMMFLVALSTLALLRAVESGERRWWVIYALAACAAVWTHYTAVFVIAAQAGWAMWAHRERLKELVIAGVAIAVGYLPWLPGFLEQRRNDVGIEIIGELFPLSFGRVFELPLVALVGHPFLSLGDSPGPRGLLLAAFLAAIVLAAAVRSPGVLRGLAPSLRSEAGLVALLAFATPIGLLLYAAADSSLYIPRNLAASVPAALVLIALLLDRLAAAISPRLAPVALAGFLAVLAIGTVEIVFDDDQRRPAYREAAHYLDDVALPMDAVVDTPLTPAGDSRFRRTTLDLYFAREHRLYATGRDEGAAWRTGRAVYLVAPEELASPTRYVDRVLGDADRAPAGLVRRLRRFGGPDGRALLREETTLPGIFPISVVRFAGEIEGRLQRRDGQETISWPLGRRVIVSPGVARGAVEMVTPSTEPLSISGWALDATRPRPVDWVLFFSRDRLFAVSAGGIARPDIARLQGTSALLSGFVRPSTQSLRDRSTIRVFAVVGDRASELALSDSAKRSLR
jgi:4-amino-4-deoxy-L-arabinose transferase-like glycosyltransferase